MEFLENCNLDEVLNSNPVVGNAQDEVPRHKVSQPSLTSRPSRNLAIHAETKNNYKHSKHSH